MSTLALVISWIIRVDFTKLLFAWWQQWEEALGLSWVPHCPLLCKGKRGCVLPWGVCRRGDPWEGQVQGGRRSPHSSKSGLNLQMVLQMWHKAKLPSGSAACPMLEASCGFSALLAHWDRALHILVGCILLLVHRGLQGLQAGRELRTEACAGNLRLWELCGHSLGWMGSSPPMASWIKQGALAGGWKMVGAGWQLLGSLQCIHPAQGVHRCLLCNDALWASFGEAFSPPLTSGPSTSGKTNHA